MREVEREMSTRSATIIRQTIFSGTAYEYIERFGGQ